MPTIEELLQGKTPAQQISTLKLRRNCPPAPKVKLLDDQFNPPGHRINDRAYRPDKPIKGTRTVLRQGKEVEEKYIERWEEVNRIAVSLQKKIVNSAVSFVFTTPVAQKAEVKKGSKEEIVFEALKSIYFKNKINSFNRRVARELFRYGEFAEYWYPVEYGDGKKHDIYGLKSSYKLKVQLFSPGRGDELYPYFDESGDLVAFSRQYYINDVLGKEQVYFDTYLKDRILRYHKDGGGQWELETDVANPIGKIPIVYYCQPGPEWADVQPLIDRLEKLLSNFGETNDYHASPKIFVNGKIKGWSKKGEAGAILEGEKDAKAEYLSWDHAPESVKLELDTLLRLIYSLTQTPDVSFDSVKGIGNVTGIALKLLFMDAHLKVFDKAELFGEGFQRRNSVVGSYIGQMDKTYEGVSEDLYIESVFTPYMIDTKSEWIQTLMQATGGKAILSQEKGTELAALTPDPEEDYKRIKKEEEESSTFDVFGQGR